MEINQLTITGTVADVLGLRYTPAGVPHFSFVIEHRSRQEQAGAAREVQCRIRVEARGEQTVQQCNGLAISDRVQVSGFLARAYFKDHAANQLILNAQQIELRT